MAALADSSRRARRDVTAVLRRQAVRAGAGSGTFPASYFEYLEMLDDVFAECVRELEPGGRIAVNVANLGRKPYRSLSGPTSSRILQDISACCCGARSSGRRPEAHRARARGALPEPGTNPVLRDLSERVVVASKGRFDRATSVRNGSATRAAVRDLDLQGRVLGGDDRRLGDPAGDRHARRPSGPVPGRAPRSASSVSTRIDETSCSIRSWVRARPQWPRYATIAGTSASTPTQSYVDAARRAVRS